MQYHMSTEKGMLDDFNCHSNNHLLHGTVQGATDSPLKWNFNNNILANAYNKKAHGCMLHNPTGKLKKKNYSVQHYVTLHSNYLWVLGGLLELMKTHYMLIIWMFLANGCPKLMEEEKLPPNDILIRTTTGYTTKLDRIPVNKGSRMLG
eukprot:1454720-Ditylum_brightwellii.AAC.1